jgi:hypothetical protein
MVRPGLLFKIRARAPAPLPLMFPQQAVLTEIFISASLTVLKKQTRAASLEILSCNPCFKVGKQGFI